MDENSIQKTEIPPKEIFKLMKSNIFDNFTQFSPYSINKDYLNSRKALFYLLHKMTIKMGFKSQTFFLCAHYLDIIFTKKKRINLNLNILGLSCLCLAAKYCENDPMVPHLQYFIKIFNHMNEHKKTILMSELKRGEVAVLKILNYKLNYFTIYDFNSFLFGHGILKIEQLKDIENKNKKLYRSSRKKFVVNSTNSLMIKNILEKVYKKSRNYLDIIVKNTKICFKYNPLFISIYIMKRTVEEILGNERKINLCDKKEKDEFKEKNNLCFKQIMYDFYKINYEENEQYKRIIEDEEINVIFGDKEKNEKVEEVEPAPCADKKIYNEAENFNDINNNNKNLFINTYTTGFYKRMKLKENIIDIDKNNNEELISSRNEKSNLLKINNKRDIEIKNSLESNSGENKEEDDLDLNLNINEIQNENNRKINSKKNSTSYNFYSSYNSTRDKNKNNLVQNNYIMTTENRDVNLNSNKNNIGNNYDLTYSVEPSRGNKGYLSIKDKTSPLKYSANNMGNLTGIKKYVKIKGINTALDRERNDYAINMNNNTENNNSNSTTNINNNYNYNTIKKFEKQPYFKKLINNDSNINSINRNRISSYYLTNTDLNKNKVDNNYRNTVNTTNTNTFNRIKTKNVKNKIMENNTLINNEKAIDLNQKESQVLSTTSSRYRKIRNKKEDYNNLNNISTEVKNARYFIIQDNDDKNNKNKKEIESYTQNNWNINSNNKNSNSYRYKKDNIFIRKNKILNMDNDIGNLEDKKNLTNTNFYKNSINNNSNRITVNTSHNNNPIEKKIQVNTLENSGSQKVYQSIRQRYLNMKNKKINNNINNNNISNNNNFNDNIELDKNKTATYFYKKNTNNNNLNNQNQKNYIKEKNEPQIENKSKYKKISDYSIFNIINKTKSFFSKNNNPSEEPKRINDKKITPSYKNNINNTEIFYKSQHNFYQPKNKPEINNNNINYSRKEPEIKNNSYMSKHLINNKLNKENQNSQIKKNPSTIVINNNININIGNKTNNINNEYTKYKNIYKKSNVQPQTNQKRSNNGNTNTNNNNNNIDKVNKGINLSHIFSKFQFYKKSVNKNNNNN